MGVLLNADADYLSVSGGPASTGLTNYTLWTWHRRTSGVGYSAVDSSNIFAQEGNAGRHNRFGFDNTFGSGTENDPRLSLADNGGATQFATGDDHPPFDTWTFFVLVCSGAAGSVTGKGFWTSDGGNTWHTQTKSMTGTENSITPAQVNFGRAIASDPQCSQGDYAYAGCRAEALSDANAQALVTRSATAAGDWAYWRLLNASSLADSSGNGRNLTANGTVTDGADPTIGGGGGGGTPLTIPVAFTPLRWR